jgi:hypothetical protein
MFRILDSKLSGHFTTPPLKCTAKPHNGSQTKEVRLDWLPSLLCNPLNISLPLTSWMSACHTLFWEQNKSPSGPRIIKKQCYESWHLMNNYFKNLFISIPSSPDGWVVVSTKLLKLWWEHHLHKVSIAFFKKVTFFMGCVVRMYSPKRVNITPYKTGNYWTTLGIPLRLLGPSTFSVA